MCLPVAFFLLHFATKDEKTYQKAVDTQKGLLTWRLQQRVVYSSREVVEKLTEKQLLVKGRDWIFAYVCDLGTIARPYLWVKGENYSVASIKTKFC